MAFLNFDANTVEPRTEYTALPAGEYEVVITDSEMKSTKANTGKYLEIRAEVIAGEFKGRKLFTRLNLENPNPTAVEIARRELSSICHAVGVLHPTDSAELHNLPLIARVRQTRREDGATSNDITAWLTKPRSATVAATVNALTPQGPNAWRR